MRHEFTPEAQHDLLEALDWYESRQPGLAARFEGALRQTLERLLAFPDSARPVVSGGRAALVPGFPYLLYYTCTSESLTIQAVWQAEQDPAALARRLSQSDDE